MATRDVSRDNLPKASPPEPAPPLEAAIPPEGSPLSETQLPHTRETAVEFERTPENRQPEDDPGTIDKAIDLLTRRLRKPKKQKPTHIPQMRDEITVQVEKILEDGLADAYKELTPLQQQELKIQGEKTAIEIRKLLKGTHVKIKKIFLLIVEWLKILPGVNRFFIEQEAKIKADKIVALKDHLDR